MTPEQLNSQLAAIPNAELAARARKWITDLCNSGGQRWTLRVPPDPAHDPDLIFGELCRRVEAMEEVNPEEEEPGTLTVVVSPDDFWPHLNIGGEHEMNYPEPETIESLDANPHPEEETATTFTIKSNGALDIVE